MRCVLFAMAALAFAACGAAGAQTVVVGPNGVAVFDRSGSGFAFSDHYRGPVHSYHGGQRWRDERWRDDRYYGHGRHKDWKRHDNGYAHGWRDDRHASSSSDCRRIERRDWINGRRVLISEVVCFDRFGSGHVQHGSRQWRDCPDHYRGW